MSMSDETATYRALGRRFSAERMAENYLFRPPYPRKCMTCCWS